MGPNTKQTTSETPVRMKKLIKMLVEQAIDELVDTQEPTVYFDMDGVLADFKGGLRLGKGYVIARK